MFGKGNGRLGKNMKTQILPLANRRNIRCTKGPAKTPDYSMFVVLKSFMFLHLEDCQFLLSFHPLSCLQVIMHSLKEKGGSRRGCPCLEERGVF